MGSRTTPMERARDRALRFHSCPSCTYDFATGEGVRGCSYGACPYLPEELDVHCPRCWFNFYTGEGRPGCGDPATCDFARDEAPLRVASVRRWLQQRGPP
jgi:hypothetical protein